MEIARNDTDFFVCLIYEMATVTEQILSRSNHSQFNVFIWKISKEKKKVVNLNFFFGLGVCFKV